ncbi:acyltransferase family protein [Actinomycetospora straminea]|nr:acyltransferase family protein [Actinomycetospora straminea]MDD7934642.1 acyltransferase family protein [Actinomycetospora straminea]
MTSTADRRLGSRVDTPAAVPDRPAAGSPAAPGPGRQPSDGSRFRPEIEGLRAVASVLVVVYHVWIGRVSGGVDVFFALTGFLAAGQLVRASERGGIDLLAQWGRTLRRLVPPAAVVLVGTVVASILLLPESRWPQAVREAVASAFFVENWRLAADAVDYYASHDTASVVQHFWSLSIQGQFAIAFPLVVVVATLAARRRGIAARPAVAGLLAVVTAVSLVWSITSTAADQTYAYFDALARVWEFTLGGLLALGLHRLRLPVWAGVAAGWLGIVGLAACGVVLDVEGGFPGYLALWPVACAAAVIVAGDTDHRLGTTRLLASRPMQYLGSISFPLYLWHWPVLLLASAAFHVEQPGPVLGLAIIGTSLMLAAATRHLVEDPVLRRGRRRPGVLRDHRAAAVALVPVLVLVLAWHAVTTVRAEPSGAVGDADHPGALARAPGFVDRGSPDAEPIPPAVSAYEDWVRYRDAGTGCAGVPGLAALELCTYVPAPDPAARTIVVVGDSHMQQFLPAVAPVAHERGWRVQTLIRPGCPLSTTAESNPGEADCITWNQEALGALASLRPALVVAQATHDVRQGRTERTPPGMVEAWNRLASAGVPVLGVRDNPRFGYAPPSCVDTYGRGAPECDVPRSDLYPADPAPPGGAPSTMTVLDLSDSICEPTVCPPEIGRVMVYLDDNHLTATFTASLAPVVGPRIAALVGP